MQNSNTETKVYKIANIAFTLKQKYTLGELDTLTEFFNGIMPGPNNKIVRGTFSNKEIINVLSIVLDTEVTLDDNFSFGLCDETTAGEVILDFMRFKMEELLKNFRTQNNLDVPLN